MTDPIGSFTAIRENFIRYVQTAFKTRFTDIESERETLLRLPGTFYQDPYIEPMPKYAQSKKLKNITLADLGNPPGFTEASLERLKGLAMRGLIGNFPLHSHQMEMLKRSLAKENLVVTAGTGSGKTEAFMLPLLAAL